MSSKKRKTSEATLVPESNKRITRSSVKGITPRRGALSEPPKVKSNTLKSATTSTKASQQSKTNTNDSSRKAKNGVQKDKRSTEALESTNSASTPSNVKELSITSDLAKNPIACHSYTPPSSNNSSTPYEHSINASTLIFTHGAGGTLSAPAVVDFCTGFATALPVLAFQGSANLPARAKGFHACLKHIEEQESSAQNDSDQNRLVLGGRSMGARAAVMAATQILQADNDKTTNSKTKVFLVLISYPLKGPKDDIRDQILLDLPDSVSVLFITGDRDAMCPLELLDSVREKMKAQSQWAIVRGADHGMHVKPANPETDREFGEQSGREAAAWLARDGKEESA